jgi:hypothetical protein
MSSLPERQEAINKYFDDFLANASEDESLDEMMEAFDEAIYMALIEKLGYTNSSDEQKMLVRTKMNEFMISMDLNAPELAHAEKMLRSIGAADFKRAAKYLEQLFVARSTAFSEIQTSHANKPRSQDPLSKLLALFNSRKPDISAADAISQLESGAYSDVVIDFDNKEITYSLPDGRSKTINKSSIPARLSRLRNK